MKKCSELSIDNFVFLKEILEQKSLLKTSNLNFNKLIDNYALGKIFPDDKLQHEVTSEILELINTIF